MSAQDQVLRFAVGEPDGPRSRTWRLWVPTGQSNVYVSGRTLGSSVKVSLHEPGPARFALTKEWVKRTGFQAPPERDYRLAVEWDRPRPSTTRVARPLTVIVPHEEVLPRARLAGSGVVWVVPPREGNCVHFDIVYVAEGIDTSLHPGARSMGTGLVGRFSLANGQTVFVTSIERELHANLLLQLRRLQTARVLAKNGGELQPGGMLAFGTEPNVDANDGTSVGLLMDVTRLPAAGPAAVP